MDPALAGSGAAPALGSRGGVAVKSELLCACNREDDAFQADVASGAEDLEIDVAGFAGGDQGCSGKGLARDWDEDEDRTEESSSFGDSEGGSDCGDGEVSSSYCGVVGNGVADFINRRQFVERKKVTAHWRQYVRPLTWRCQWLELHYKELLSQISKYDRKLALLKNKKKLHLQANKGDGSMSRTVPLECTDHGNSVMMRRRRKQDEHIIDSSMYMKKHIILSYNEAKCGGDSYGHVVEDDQSASVNINVDREWLMKPAKDVDGSRQLSLLEVISQIDDAHSRLLEVQAYHKDVIDKLQREMSLQVNPAPRERMSTRLRRSSSRMTSPWSVEVTYTNQNDLLRCKDEPDVACTENWVDIMFEDGNFPEPQEVDIRVDATQRLNRLEIPSSIPVDEVVKERTPPHADIVMNEVQVTSMVQCVELTATAVGSARQEDLGCTINDAGGLHAPLLKPSYSGKRRGRKPKLKTMQKQLAAGQWVQSETSQQFVELNDQKGVQANDQKVKTTTPVPVVYFKRKGKAPQAPATTAVVVETNKPTAELVESKKKRKVSLIDMEKVQSKKKRKASLADAMIRRSERPRKPKIYS